jgi:hypothetical protein
MNQKVPVHRRQSHVAHGAVAGERSFEVVPGGATHSKDRTKGFLQLTQIAGLQLTQTIKKTYDHQQYQFISL